MTIAPLEPARRGSRSSDVSRWARKVVILLLIGLGLGVAYDWAAPRLYRPEREPGFVLGVVHGALMPVALPALLLGRDVPIYATNHAGRIYRIGYIAGINLCGLVFFGVLFRKPPRSLAAKQRDALSGEKVTRTVSPL